MSTMRYGFVELPDFWDGEFRSGLHNGWADISYTMQEIEGTVGILEWRVDRIVLDCPNGKCGDAAESKLVELGECHLSMLETLVQVLHNQYAVYIEDAIRKIEFGK